MPNRHQAALLRGLRALSLACIAGAATAADSPPLPQPAPTLTLGRQPSESATADIAEAVVGEACRRAGIALRYKRMPLARTIEAASDGDLDGDLQRIDGVASQYPNLITVPTAINRIDLAVYAATPDIASKTRAQVERLRIAYPRGTYVFAKHSQRAVAVQAQSSAAALELVRSGRVEAALVSHVLTEQQFALDPASRLHLWPHVWASEPSYLVLNRQHAALVPRIDAALREMKREGLIEKIRDDKLRELKIRPLAADDTAGTASARRR